MWNRNLLLLCSALSLFPGVSASQAPGNGAIPEVSAARQPGAEPPAPEPQDAEIRRMLAEVDRLRREGSLTEALRSADMALAKSRSDRDAAGEALAQAGRARIFEQVRRTSDWLAAWQACTEAWARAGYGPGMVEASWRASLAAPVNSPESREGITRAIELLDRETQRPRAAAGACVRGGDFLRASSRGVSARRLYEAALRVYERCEPESPTVTLVLRKLVHLGISRSELDAAEKQARRAAEIAQRRHPDSAELALALSDLGTVLHGQGSYREAEEVRRKAVEVLDRRAAGSNQLAGAHHNLGATLLGQWRLDEAEASFQAALNIYQGAGAEVKGSATARANTTEALGAVASRRGQLKTAHRLVSEAYELRRSLDPNSEAVSVSLANLAGIHLRRGELDAADEQLAQAHRIRVRFGTQTLGIAGLLRLQGEVATARGQLTRAAELFRRALAIYDARAPASPLRAECLMELAELDYHRAALPEAWEQYSRALAVLEKEQRSDPGIVRALGGLGKIARLRGDFDVARTLLERALEEGRKIRSSSTTRAELLLNLGTSVASDGQGEAARGYLAAVATDPVPGARGLDLRIRALASLVELELEAGRWKEAEVRVREAEALLERQPVSLAARAMVHTRRGELFVASGKPLEAEASYRKALLLWKDPNPRWPGHALTLYRLSQLLRAQGKREEAVSLALKAWSTYQALARGITGDDAVQAYRQQQAPIAAGIAAMLAEAGQAEDALRIAEENRAQALQHLLSDSRVRPAGCTDQQWSELCGAGLARRQAEEAVASAADHAMMARSAWDQTQVSGRDASRAATLRRRLDELEEQLEAAEKQLTLARDREARLESLLRKPGPHRAPVSFATALAETRRAAVDGTLSLYYSVGDERTALFVVAPPAPGLPASPQLQVHFLPLGLKALSAEVEGVVRALREERAEGIPLGRALGARLLPAAVRADLLRSRRALIFPDGPLWELPFAALALPSPTAPTPKPVGRNEASPTGKQAATAVSPAFLGLQLPLTSAPSLALLAQEAMRARTPPGPVAPDERSVFRTLVAGDPLVPAAVPEPVPESKVAVRGSAPRSGLPGLLNLGPLPGTRVDAEAVGKLYGARPLLGVDASEEQVRKLLPEADVVHFATHGYLHPYWARASGLVLSHAQHADNATPPEKDGLLQAWEIYGLPRLRADLVVLAACETGRGSVVRGEGINGLVRAFQAAGARSVVASHWKVRDDSTRELMLAFHRRVRGGVAKDVALHQAMREVAARPGCQHPYHWGAFVLTGDRGR